MNTPTQQVPTHANHRVELVIGGMTCAACANRIERKLNKLGGVRASVNDATEKALMTHDSGIERDVLVEAVKSAGHTATLPTPPPSRLDPRAIGADTVPTGEDPSAALRWRVLVCAALRGPTTSSPRCCRRTRSPTSKACSRAVERCGRGDGW